MRLSLKRKIILTFAFFLVTNCVVWFLSYYNYYLVNTKLELLYLKNDLLNTILEARRYEKNFFLNGGKSSVEEALNYTRTAIEKIDKINISFPRYTMQSDLRKLKDNLVKYNDSMYKLLLVDSLLVDGNNQGYRQTMENTIFLGHKITVDIENIVSKDRQQVQYLISRTRMFLIVAIIEIVLISLLTAFLLFFAVNRPLKHLENAIQMISRGDYENIPEISTTDEFSSLVTSLNNMLEELNKRTDQLVQTKKMASLGTLTSGVAHELNNPLNNISTSCQILLEELEEDNLDFKREQLTEMQRQIDRARDIVRALLEFSREKTFTITETSIKELIDNTVKLIKGEVPANVEVVINAPDDLRVEVDPRRIQQALLNLFLNALQAMELGGTLSIDVVANRDKNSFIIKIQDTGKGIPRENLSKIFDPFFTTKDIGKGTGLGLSVTHGIIEQHRGKISVESFPEEGTTFTIELPIRSSRDER